MTSLPLNAPALARQQAELSALRWVASHLLAEHARIAAPHECLCAVCRAAAEWVEPRQAIPHPHPMPRCPLLKGGDNWIERVFLAARKG
jgi:hypothetical protein